MKYYYSLEIGGTINQYGYNFQNSESYKILFSSHLYLLNKLLLHYAFLLFHLFCFSLFSIFAIIFPISYLPSPYV